MPFPQSPFMAWAGRISPGSEPKEEETPMEHHHCPPFVFSREAGKLVIRDCDDYVVATVPDEDTAIWLTRTLNLALAPKD